MATIIKLVLLSLCALVVFFKNLFTTSVMYWCTFGLMFALIPLWWLATYWVSKSRASKILKEEPEKSFFVGMVPSDVNDDLIRGRLCIAKDEIYLVTKHKDKYEIIWTEKITNITNARSEKVAGIRKGFIIYTNEGENSFVCNLADEVIKAILKS